RCHTGHGFTARTLQDAMAATGDDTLVSARRALQERELLLRHMAEQSRASGLVDEAARLYAAAGRLHDQGGRLVELMAQGPEPLE
ncbi:MAG: hypothetical protein JO090_05975, partial [Rhizobacter sp.]|nr:hypothetical protein [Rhizobacter sp.]